MDNAVETKRSFYFYGLSIAACGVFFDFSMISTILAYIERDLQSTYALQLVMILNVLVMGSFLVLTGRIADRFGKKRFMIIALLLFAAGSVGVALSFDAQFMIFFRALQGLANAMIISISLSFIHSMFSKDQRMHRVTIWSAMASLGLVLGPIVGGTIINWISWRYSLISDVVIAFYALGILIYAGSSVEEERSDTPMDWRGFFLLLIFLIAITIAIVFGPVWGWHYYVIHLMILTSIISFFLFWIVEKKQKYAIIPFHFFPNKIFVGSFIGNFALFFLIASEFFFLPLFLQNMTNLPTYIVGLLIAPLSLFVLIVSPSIGKIVKATNMKILVLAGFAMFMLTAAVQLYSHSFFFVLAGIFCCAIAWSLSFIPLQRTTFYTLPEKFSKMILQGFFTINAIGGTIGIAFTGAVFRLGETMMIKSLLDQNNLFMTEKEVHLVKRSLFNLTQAQEILNYFTSGRGKEFIFIFQRGFLSGFDWVNWVILSIAFMTLIIIGSLFFLKKSSFDLR